MLKRLFDYAVVRGMIEVNPAISFGSKDAGEEQGRKRALSRDELIQFFKALRRGRGISRKTSLLSKSFLRWVSERWSYAPQNGLSLI
jgi:hypothetical protein